MTDPLRRTAAAVTALLLSAAASTVVLAGPAAADPCGAGGNEIACENSLPGSPRSEWEVQGAGDDSIQGFATDISVDAGSRIGFKVDTDAGAYAITVYRLGYYGGDGAREVASLTPTATLPQSQPECLTDVSTELYDCGNWAESASWDVPSTAVSGVYIARLERTDNGDASHITFVVRDDDSNSDVVFQTSDPTWQAYNTYGGSDFYQGAGNGRAHKISYNRPVLTRDGPGGRDFFFSNEYPLVRFLERNGYDVSYIAGVDTDRSGDLLQNHGTFLSVGHDEYWSKAQRANVEAARDAGVNLQFLSGNEVYWKTRYEPSADASNTPYRTLVSYKETWSNAKIDPSAEWTGTWRDPRFAPRSAGGGRPENALTGTAYTSNFTDLPVRVNAEEGRYRLWRHTSLASLAPGTSQALAPHTVGYESDEDLDNGERPPGLVRLSTSTGDVPQYLQDFGNEVAEGTTTHHLTLYRAGSGALVFGAGTVQWTWGLDAEHDSAYAPEPADPRMQQAQVNLLADMGAQPATPTPGLTVASASTDTTGPTVTVGSPAAGSTQPNGSLVTVTGTAADTGAGRVAGVEVSTDGGNSWHPATGTTAWSHTYVQHGRGSVPVRVRAVDDSANIGPAVTRAFSVECPCSVLGDRVPTTATATDPSAVELGLRFTPTANGYVEGVRFWKGVGNSGTHLGSLWSASGARLATATFTGESNSGWQSVGFGSPVPVVAGETYVVSYTAPNGHYEVKPWAFSSAPTEADPLLVEGGFGAPAAGVYAGAGLFPHLTFENANYYVDVRFTTTDSSAPVATSRWPLPGSSSVPADTTVSARFSKPVDPGSVTVELTDANDDPVSGETSYDATDRVVTFTPDADLAGFVKHTVRLTAIDGQGQGLAAGATWSFTTARPPGAPGVCPCSLFDEGTVPTILEDVDTNAVTLGVRFSPDVDGTVTAVRFYKGVNNTGTHTGALWSAGGQQLATGTFADESTSGWQELVLDDPVSVDAGATYVASYRTEVGRYSASPNAFAAQDLSRPPLRVTSSAGAFTYGTGFPSSTSSTSYLVDVVFERGDPELTITGQDPPPGAVDVPRGSPVRVTFSDPVAPGYALSLREQSGGAAIPGTVALDSGGTRLTLTPDDPLPADTDLRVDLADVTSTQGATLADTSWTFRTRTPGSTAGQSLFTDEVPDVAAAAEKSPVELGTAFVPARDGRVTAVRFHKGPGNAGVHTGSLWTAGGARLGTVTFVGESSTGWQQATLSPAVPVTAGQTYVVSYLAPQGHYSYTSGFFAQPFSNGDLAAPGSNNGRYVYGAGGGFPGFSWASSNYFVDVVFEPDPATISVTSRTPGPGATDVPRGTAPSIRLSSPVADGWGMTVSSGGSSLPGSAARSGDGRSLTFTPDAALPADADVRVDVTGVVSTEGAELPAQSWTFHTEASSSGTTLTTMFGDATPSNPSVNDTAAVELGTAFTPQVDGTVVALRFYQGSGNGGTHVGTLWTAAGAQLARITFTGETGSGWQSATLPSPVALTAGSTYVVSYLAPQGRYAATPAYFAGPRTSGPLVMPGSNNGRYRYGASGGFPTQTFNATSYSVDVVFRSTSP